MSAFSRRGFLKGTTALAAAVGAIPTKAQTGQVIAYVGPNSDKGKGINIFYVNASDGSLMPWKILTGIPSASSLAFHPNKKYLYSVNSISNFNGTTNGSVTSMSVDSGTGDLRIMNVVSSEGGNPAHLSVDPSGKWVFAANYGGGSGVVLPIRSDGMLGPAADVVKFSGPQGPMLAVDAPPGSFAISAHDAPHAHMAEMDPGGKYFLITELGADRIYSFKINQQTGKLTPNDQPYFQASPGSGPRHFAFHPNGRFMYTITEEGSTMILTDYDPDTGRMTYRQTVSTLPPGFAGTNFPSAVYISPDGNLLYGLNRLFDTAVIYDINQEGWMLNARHVWTHGSYPRELGVEPNGNYMYILHTRSDNLTSFRIDKSTGMLDFTGQFVPVGDPSSIVFLRL